MINEIKKVWKQYSILLLLFFLLEIILTIFGRFAADFLYWELRIDIEVYIIIQMFLPVVLIFFFAFTKEPLIDFEHALPISKIKMFFNKFIPAILSVVLINITLYCVYIEDLPFNLFSFIISVFAIGYVFFLFVYFMSTFKNLYLILLILISTYIYLFPIKIINPLTQEMVDSFITINNLIIIILISTTIPLIIYFFSYIKNYYYKIKVMIITFVTYIILMQGSMFLEIYSHKGKPLMIVGYDRYISLTKSVRSGFKTICYDIETKKTKRKIIFGFVTYIWDEDRMIINEKNSTTINLQKFKTKGKSDILNIECNIYQDAIVENPSFIFRQICGPSDSYYICKDNRVLKVNLKTLILETVFDNIILLSKNRNNAIIIQHDEKYYAVSSIFGIKILTDLGDDFIFGKDYFFIIDENKIYDESGNTIYSSDYKLTSIRSGRAFQELPSSRYVRGYFKNKKHITYYNNQFFEIPNNSKFNDDKIYYHSGSIITFSYPDGTIIVKQKFDIKDFIYRVENGNQINISNNYLIYQYKDNYYLFLYGRNPVKVYKLANDTWEFYDSFQ